MLIDPVIQPETMAPAPPGGSTYTRLSTFRRDIWPSRADAAATFRKNRFYASWDEHVMKLWLEFGLRDLPTAVYPESPYPGSSDRPVTLATTKHQEVFTFLRPNFHGLDSAGNPVVNRHTHPDVEGIDTYPFYRPEAASTFRSLPHLRPSALYIFGGQSQMSPPEWRKKKLEATGRGIGGSGGVPEGRVKEVLLEKIGHLIPMDAVDDCAQAAADWLTPEMQRWQEEEEGFRKAWSAKEKRERFTVSEEWKKQVGGDPRADPPKAANVHGSL